MFCLNYVCTPREACVTRTTSRPGLRSKPRKQQVMDAAAAVSAMSILLGTVARPWLVSHQRT